MKKLVAIMLVTVVCLIAGSAYWQSAFLLPNLISGSSFHPLNLISRDPKVSEIEIPFSGGSLRADIYTPAHESSEHGAFLLVPGGSALGKNDPRIENFGQTLARAGVAVLIPDLPDITARKFDLNSVPEVVAAFSYLKERYPEKKKGILAFSIATGPMFMAAADPMIASSIDYLVSFGGYADLKEVIRNAATAEDRDMTESGEIRDIFAAQFGKDPAFDALLRNTDPAEFDGMYAALTPQVKDFVSSLSPLPYLPSIKVPRVLLLHSDPDPDVPTKESEELKAVLGDKAELVILKSFSHTDLTLERFTLKSVFNFYIPELWKLYRVAYKVLTF